MAAPTDLTPSARLLAAGYTPEQVNSTIAQMRATWRSAGYSEEQIAATLGDEHPNPVPLQGHFRGVLEAAASAQESAAAEGAEPKEFGFDEAFSAGFGQSVTGLLARQRAPDAVPENMDFVDRLAFTLGGLTGDAPAMLAGAVIAAPAGGGVASAVTAAGGAFALPAALRHLLIERYTNGEIKSFRRFWDVASGAFLAELKGFAVGAATGGAGQAVSKLAPAILPAGATRVVTGARLGAEVSTMVAAGAALEGRVPEPQEFIDAAVLVGGLHGVTVAAGRVRSLYARTGVTPEEVARDANVEPTIREDLLSENIETPRAYRAAEEAEATRDPSVTTEVQRSQAALEDTSREYLERTGQAERPAIEVEHPVTLERVDLQEPKQPVAPAGSPDRLKYPVIGMLKAAGGVRIGSPLAAELAAMDVTPKSFPGLFRRDSGIGAADTFVASEGPLFSEYIGQRGEGYIPEQAILDAIRSELAGKPRRSEAFLEEQAHFEQAKAERDAGKVLHSEPLEGGGYELQGYHATPDGEMMTRHGGVLIGTPRAAVAASDGNLTVAPTTLRMRKPMGTPDAPISEKEFIEITNSRQRIEELRAQGYDGIIFKNESTDPGTVSAFALLPAPKALPATAGGAGGAAATPPGGGAPPPGGGGPPAGPAPAAPGGGGGAGPPTFDQARADVLARLSIDQEAPQPPQMLSRWERFYTDWIDKYTPMGVFVDRIAKGRKVAFSRDPYKLLRNYAGQRSLADHFLSYGTVDYATRGINGIALRDILRPIEARLDDFRALIASERVLELEARGITTGVDTTSAQVVVQQLRRDPALRQASLELDTYQLRVLEYFRDAGMLTDQMVRDMRAENMFYVPFYRVLDEVAGGPAAGKGLQVRQLVRRITGSEREIVDPLESVMKNTYALVEMSERNKIGVAFTDMAQADPDGAQWATRTPPNRARPIELTSQEKKALVRQVMGNAQLTPSQEIALTQMFQIFRRDRLVAGKDQIVVYKQGVREVWDVAREVWEIFEGLDAQRANLVIRMLAQPSRLLRAGTVLSPEFMARNIFRDQISSFIFSHVGIRPWIDAAQGLFEVAGRGQYFQEWTRSGGPMAALVSMDRTYLQQNLRSLLEQGGLRSAARNVARNPIEALRILSETVEYATRVGTFMRARKKGMSVEEAGFESREGTIDFNRMGAKAQSLAQIIAFWNPQVQGFDKMMRAMKENPQAFAARALAGVTLPSLVLYLMNRDEPWYKEIPQWQKDLFWLFSPDGGETVWRIPKPFEIGVIFGSALGERVPEWLLGQNPRAFDDLLSSLLRGASPGVLPTASVPLLEMWANRNMFLDRPIVPQSRERLLPEYQYNVYTTEFSKAIGGIMASVPGMKFSKLASPAIIDNFVRGWTGGLGAYAIKIANASLTAAGLLPERLDPETPLNLELPFVKAFAVRYPSLDMESLHKFHERFAEERMFLDTVNTLAREGEPEAALRELQIRGGVLVDASKINQALIEMTAVSRAIYRDKRMTPEEKRQNLDQIILMMVQTAQLGLTQLDAAEKARKELAEGAAK